MYLIILKYFLIIWGSIYTCSKMINKSLSPKDVFLIIPYVALSSVLTYKLRPYIISLNIIIMFASIFIFVFFKHKKVFTKAALLSLFSFGIGIVSYVISVLLSFPSSYVLYITIKDIDFRTYMALLISGIIQFISLYSFFKIKRFQNLFTIIENRFSNNAGIFISLLVLTAASLFYNGYNELNLTTLSILFILFCIFGILRIKKYISEEYLNSIKRRNMDNLEKTISKQNELISKLTDENEKLSKIIHRGNN